MAFSDLFYQLFIKVSRTEKRLKDILLFFWMGPKGVIGRSPSALNLVQAEKVTISILSRWWQMYMWTSFGRSPIAFSIL